MGLYNAVKRSPIAGGWEDKTDPDLESMLTQTVSSTDILNVLIGEDLVEDDARVLELSFTEFDGSPTERGVTATQTEIVSTPQNDGWPMFFAGFMIALLFATIAVVGSWVFKKETGHWPFMQNKDAADDGSNRSVHFQGDVDLEEMQMPISPTATTASGVLGLKGYHPAEADLDAENFHPNSRAYRRKGRSSSSNSSSSKTDNTTNASIAQSETQKSGAKLGIVSMRRLNSFLTPQKPKSSSHDARVSLYDVERLTRT